MLPALSPLSLRLVTRWETLEATYKTSDLYYAAYLKVAGVNFIDVEREGARTVFVFTDQGPSIMREFRRQYFSDEAKVPAQTYAQALRSFKGLVYAG